MRRLPAATVGAAAHRLLARGGAGRVVAAFRRSLYVDLDGGLICVGPPEFGPGPLHLLAPTDEAWGELAVAGARVRACRSGLVVGTLACDVRGLVPWSPPPPPYPGGLSAGLAGLRAEATRRKPPGLGACIAPLCAGALPPRGDPVVARAASAAAALMDWVRGGGREDPPRAAETLLGLGPGLTPSGDDFLGGFLVALRRLGAADLAGRLAAAVMPRAAAATNTISAALLAAAAEGGVSAALIAACDAIAGGGRGLGPRLDRVAAIGHSSGWDCLAGMTAAAVAVRQRRAHAPPTLG
ncbi:conserved exported hypothetical protein [uncultured Alphaproteobacteria bacterium]|uniref:DUF2877 domain-containing protein n=1 Tax=uncultured Alphaproteobacteria bacterium TaxID=91750 RepID=A0A212KMH2_9PROT|nr:conserved exported hypothetical protein [uncultured Alphaproteobacteria bacterium]